MRPAAPVLAFLERLGELAEAHALETRIGLLRKAAEIAPAAVPALDAQIAELRTERLAIDLPVLLCPYCGYEWAGRRRPRLQCYATAAEVTTGGSPTRGRTSRRAASGAARDELPEDFRRRMAAWCGAGSIWCDEQDDPLDDQPRTATRA